MLLEFSEKEVGKIVMELPITEKDIENVIVTSMEGGSNYWMGLDVRSAGWEQRPAGKEGVPVSQWATKLLIEGSTIRLYDIEDPDEDDVWELTLEKLIAGIKQYQEQPSHYEKDDWDGDSADSIMQYALFGKLVYG